jgi:hypothetical protein
MRPFDQPMTKRKSKGGRLSGNSPALGVTRQTPDGGFCFSAARHASSRQAQSGINNGGRRTGAILRQDRLDAGITLSDRHADLDC